MTLSKKTYVKDWGHSAKEEKFKIVVTKGGKPYLAIKPQRVTFVEEDVID